MIKVIHNYLYRITHSAWNITFMIMFILISLMYCSARVPVGYNDLSALDRSLPDIRISEVMNDIGDEYDLIPSGISREVWNDALTNANGSIRGIFEMAMTASVAAGIFSFFQAAMNIKGDGVINMSVAGISRRKIYLGTLITSALLIFITIAVAVGEFFLMGKIYHVPALISIPFILHMLLIVYLADLGFMSLVLALLFGLQKPILTAFLSVGLIISIYGLTVWGSVSAMEMENAEFLDVYDEYIELYFPETEEDKMKYMAAKEAKDIVKGNKIYRLIDGVEYEPNDRLENKNPNSEPWIFLHKIFVADGSLMPFVIYNLAGSGDIIWAFKAIDRHYTGWTVHCLLLTAISSTIGVEYYRRRRN